MTSPEYITGAIAICIAGAVLTLLLSRAKRLAGWLAFVTTIAGAGLVLSAATRALAGVSQPTASPASSALAAATQFLRFQVDGLSAVFLILAAVISVLAALYSISYMNHYTEYGVARYYPCFLLLVAGIYAIFCTTDMMWVWLLLSQFIILPGCLLIGYESRNRRSVRAAFRFLLMMELACAAVMAGAALLAAAPGGAGPSYDLGALRAGLPSLLIGPHYNLVMLAFALLLVGFGIRLGMWPFGQLWLPEASAAPSPVSALLSGVMIKTGVYGLMRSFLWLVPGDHRALFPLETWGGVIVIFGVITLFTGTMQALKQEESKRLLEYHSIGQVGYILLGTGTCMVLLAAGSAVPAVLAAMAFYGALLHVINHGLFKGLLFLNSGSMLYATGTQDLNRMGGLIRFMPLTAITALVASFSISGVPLFNGFVSKWSIYVAAILGSGAGHYLAVCAIVAIVTSALTLASFIKFFGVSFLSRTSDLVKAKAAASAHPGCLEVPWMMQVPQVVLALACILLGVVPVLGFRLIQLALKSSPEGMGSALAAAAPAMNWKLVAPLGGTGAVFAPVALFVVLALMFLVARGIAHLGGAPRRVAVPWLCGYAQEADCFRYRAHNFYGEIKRYFRWIGGGKSTQYSVVSTPLKKSD
jgi:formate hydrogenlyase subunit 3/multisubunit Na+/H+ antiporter MnhD subunit